LVLTVSFELSLVIGLFCHHHQRNAQHCRQLDASVEASGPHDFTVRSGALRPGAPSRPSQPAPDTRDDREAPLLEGRGPAGCVELICPSAQADFFGAGVAPMRPIGTTGKSRNAL
jgi:hypothetical protein